MIRRLRHRWRFRTAQVTRLRAAVYVTRCPECHRTAWFFEHHLMIGDQRYAMMACPCGERQLWMA